MVNGIIIGNGDIASALKEFQESESGPIRFIASGLSNSQNVTYADFIRERCLISQWGTSERNHLVYFSSLSIYYSNSTYSKYKNDIEEHIKSVCKYYTIVRLGNITWGRNPHTLLNYLRANPKAEKRNEIRYLVDKEEFLHWIEKIKPYRQDIMNIPGRMINVKDL